MRRTVFCAVVVCVLLGAPLGAAFGGGVPPRRAATERTIAISAVDGRCGLIFFERWDRERKKAAVFSMTPTGGQLMRLTPWKRSLHSPVVSDDARLLVFTMKDPDTRERRLFKVSAYGGAPKEVQAPPGNVGNFGGISFSPDSRRVVAEVDGDLYVIWLRRAHWELLAERALHPDWSSQDEIVYAQYEGIGIASQPDLYVADPDAGAPQPLTDDATSDDLLPTWNQAGTEVVFERYPYENNDNQNDGPYADIWRVSRSGEEFQVTHDQDSLNGVMGPRWSPNGERISFTFVNDGFVEARHISRNGDDQVDITERGWYTRDPIFSPNGKKVVLTFIGKSGQHTMRARADGTGERLLRESRRFDDSPFAWPSCS